jgi:hypothetical protein
MNTKFIKQVKLGDVDCKRLMLNSLQVWPFVETEQDYLKFYTDSEATVTFNYSLASSSAQIRKRTVYLSVSNDGVKWDINGVALVSTAGQKTFTISKDSSLYVKSSNFRSMNMPDPDNTSTGMVYNDRCTISTSGGNVYIDGDIKYLSGVDEMTNDVKYQYCYCGMFADCKNLVKGPTISHSVLAPYCYSYMFDGCTGLTLAPSLYITDAAYSCCDHMFNGCISLTDVQNIDLTAYLTEYCFASMFYGCSSLVKGPIFGSGIADYCYASMFLGCSSLESVELPSLTLEEGCYRYMFYGCENLSYIKMLANVGLNKADCLTNWTNGVNETGTFVKSKWASDWNVTGVNGIPEGWTVKTE